MKAVASRIILIFQLNVVGKTAGQEDHDFDPPLTAKANVKNMLYILYPICILSSSI